MLNLSLELQRILTIRCLPCPSLIREVVPLVGSTSAHENGLAVLSVCSWKPVSNGTLIRIDFAVETMKNTRTVQIVVLLSAAVAIGLLAPAFVPAAASVNSHSLNINPSSITYPNGNFTLTVTGLNGSQYTCLVTLTTLPTANFTSSREYVVTIAVRGACDFANG
jgi:hypothetical protein